MPKYLMLLQLNQEGLEGYLKEGFANRAQYAGSLVEDNGGTLEAFYFAYGDDDLFAIIDVPEESLAIATSLAVSRGGVGHVSTTPLITPEQMDEAATKMADYRPPGQQPASQLLRDRGLGRSPTHGWADGPAARQGGSRSRRAAPAPYPSRSRASSALRRSFPLRVRGSSSTSAYWCGCL